MAWNNSIKQRSKSLEDKFWEKVRRIDNDCWEWQAGRSKKGYGNFYISLGHSRDKHCLAHRMAWILTYGEIPDGLQVLHKCDNPPCVNPNHLFLGTNDDNVQDKIQKGRMITLRGEESPSSKLTEKEVRQIRRLRNSGFSYAELGRNFNVDISTARYICIRKLWKHIDD